ncbi:methyltransferase, FxLD system [Streptosporangium oxazolinicum]|uniref:Protein-L-isoaspartate O-methyltransferase n=1 Tax=Streptosporangium oxazolinicum TaxID=909287 RepID=A0ABP8APJ0_9ACTN
MTWRQYNIAFPDRATAEQVAADDLRPALIAAQNAGLLHGWWFVRKQPWRLRYLPDDLSSIVADLLDELAADGRIVGWTPGIYEPEALAFGGPEGMDVAHRLFHHDSLHLLNRATGPGARSLGRRESTVVLFSAMLRAAGLDWFEQGDAWAKVAALRPAEPDALAPGRSSELARAMRRLMTVDTQSLANPATGGPLVGHDGWISAFEKTGQDLADLARCGRLQRGLRAVVAHHFIFHANRAGLPLGDQSMLAALAVETVFRAEAVTRSLPAAATLTTTKVNRVTTISDHSLSADQLRTEMVDRLGSRNVIRTPAIEAAFRQTPRHLFIPDVPLEQAYTNNPIYTKTDASGASISAASQPGMVAVMLEQLALQPGERILEIGAGTGYNAAIMAAIVGENGHVVTIDVDRDLVEGAREHLEAAGVGNVEVILGDGALGHAEGAPYDRAIATVGAYEVPAAWLEQLAPGGRLVVPLRLRGTASRSIVFERGEYGWHSTHSTLAVFMPLRGIGDDARRIVALTPEEDVTLQVHKDQAVDGQALAGVLDSERHERWTGVTFPPEVPYEWMELWLCIHLPNPLMRMNVEPAATERGQVVPMFPWGSMATVQGAGLAYLTTRPARPAEDGGKLYEVGVIGHGPSQDLTERVAELVQIWNEQYRSRAVRFEMPNAPVADPAADRFVLERPHRPITVIWE